MVVQPGAIKRKFWTIVPQKHVLGREFIGRERNIIEPGLRLLIPYLHQSELVDLREQPLSFKAMETTTSDNVAMIVDAVVFSKYMIQPKHSMSVLTTEACWLI